MSVLSVSKEEIEQALSAIRQEIRDSLIFSPYGVGTDGLDKARQEAYLPILEKRHQENDWGYDDPPEEFLMTVIQSQKHNE